jgi:hypothetical protein
MAKVNSYFVAEEHAKFKISTNQELIRRHGRYSELLTINGDTHHSVMINPTRADLIELYQLQPNHRIFSAPTAYLTSAVYLALLLAKGEPMPERFKGSQAAMQLAVN